MKLSQWIAGVALALAASAQARAASMEQIVAGIVAGKNIDVSFKEKTMKVALSGSPGTEDALILSTPDQIDSLLAAVRAATPAQIIAAEKPLTLHWGYVGFGQRAIHDIADLYKKDLAQSDEMSLEIYGYDVKPVSVVGRVVSVQTESSFYYEGAAHPNASSSFDAYDGETGRKISLLEIADEQSVINAIKSDKFVRKSVQASGAGRRGLAKIDAARSYAQLSEALKANLTLCEASWYGDVESSFSILSYNPKKNQFAVRLSLSYGAEVCRGSMTQLGIWVTPKPDFAKSLKATRDGSEGFFYKGKPVFLSR